MAIKYGNLHVDEKYKPTILPNLFYRTWLVPGLTFQDVSTDSAGGWFWHKLTSSGAAEPGTPVVTSTTRQPLTPWCRLFSTTTSRSPRRSTASRPPPWP